MTTEERIVELENKCTFHVWNVVTGKWFAYTDYRTAYNKYINCVNESKGNIQYVR